MKIDNFPIVMLFVNPFLHSCSKNCINLDVFGAHFENITWSDRLLYVFDEVRAHSRYVQNKVVHHFFVGLNILYEF
jgi:hypothetical protein